MANERSPSSVLVTGGSGFVGSWLVARLLQRGYKVRATLRSPSREAEMREAIGGGVDPGDRLSFCTADLLKDDGWNRAMQGMQFVLHAASPMPMGENAKMDLVPSAREGTERVLKAAAAAGVQKVVVTSSMEAARTYTSEGGSRCDETIWTDVDHKLVNNYARSKTLGERLAWDFASKHPAMGLTTILPAFIQGPVLGPDFSGSIELISRMLRGKVPMTPRIGFVIVDIRDLADLHIDAMESDAATGQRIMAAGEFLWAREIAEILRKTFPDFAEKLPKKDAPDLLVRVFSQLSAETRDVPKSLGRRSTVSANRAAQLLGWKTRPASESIIDGARSLIAKGLA